MRALKLSLPLILMGLALLLSGANVARAQTPTSLPSTRNSQNQEAEYQQSQIQKAPTPRLVFSFTATPSEPTPTPQCCQAAQCCRAATNPQGWNYWLWQNLAALLLVIAAIWAGVIAVRTLNRIADQARTGEIAAKAAKQSADTAESTLRETEKANAIAQRAYLYLSGVRLKRYPENTIVITYPIYNAGQTPATWIREFRRANVYPVRVFPDPFKRGEVAIIKRSVTIAPH
jgi:hypothetical protein